MTQSSSPPRNAKRQNLIFALCILLIAGALFAVQAYQNAQNAATQQTLCIELHIASPDGTIVQTHSLAEDCTFTVDGYLGYTATVEVKDHAAHFVASTCPDHICEQYGWLSHEDQFATCAPAGITMMIAPAP